jgi:hypothetical protein
MHDNEKASEISGSKVEMAEQNHNKSASQDRAARSMKIGWRIGNSILCIWVAFSLWLSISLFLENRTYPGVGWAIITVIALFFLSLSVYPDLKKMLRK